MVAIIVRRGGIATFFAVCAANYNPTAVIQQFLMMNSGVAVRRKASNWYRHTPERTLTHVETYESADPFPDPEP
jgi:hypothetical protein